MPRTADEEAIAIWTESRLSVVIGDVADVTKLDTGRYRDLPGALEGRGRCSGFVGQFEIGMESGEVERHRISQITEYPVA